MNAHWTAEATDTGTRLDVFLAAQPGGISRSQIKKKAELGLCFVNQKPVSAHFALKEGDEVEIREEGTPRAKAPHRATPVKTRKTERGDTVPLEILRETADWIVLNKPAGVLVHPDHAHPDGTLIDAVIAHAPGVSKVGEDPLRPGIMSRLDKDVSGIVVIAKTQDAFEHLKRQFAEHKVTKQYLALVHGEIPTDEGDLKFRIARSTTKARMAARPVGSEGGQAAWTHYTVEKRFTGATLLRLQILSGRTHQIRAHLHAFNHPVVGDRLYELKQTKRRLTPPRLMLQSVLLAFDDPTTGERVSFTLPPDPAFETVIATL
ncbi:MAG: hypothetical protein RL141_50 [Candidatus Parcubacteria bacterium]|jgi:23S rRNA pseudouridine1911/1915/1917 synthase